MNIYLDESYNLEKHKGKVFISINGFMVANDKALRKRWRAMRKPYTKSKQRIHATNSYFERLRKKSIKLLTQHDIIILTIIQNITILPKSYFNKEKINFEIVYLDLLKNLLLNLKSEPTKKTRVLIDARSSITDKTLASLLKQEFLANIYEIKIEHSYRNILLELADFVSNTFYKEYFNESKHFFNNTTCTIIQIKNPL